MQPSFSGLFVTYKQRSISVSNMKQPCLPLKLQCARVDTPSAAWPKARKLLQPELCSCTKRHYDISDAAKQLISLFGLPEGHRDRPARICPRRPCLRA